MKNINRITGGLVILAMTFASCHKIDVPVTSELTPETYPQTEAQFNSVMGPVYTTLRNNYNNYFMLQSQTSDESVLATYAADWVDGNRYLEMHRHTWTKDHGNIGSGWNDCANLIGTTNQTIFIIKNNA